jgi:hypothetical protein
VKRFLPPHFVLNDSDCVEPFLARCPPVPLLCVSSELSGGACRVSSGGRRVSVRFSSTSAASRRFTIFSALLRKYMGGLLSTRESADVFLGLSIGSGLWDVLEPGFDHRLFLRVSPSLLSRERFIAILGRFSGHLWRCSRPFSPRAISFP